MIKLYPESGSGTAYPIMPPAETDSFVNPQECSIVHYEAGIPMEITRIYLPSYKYNFKGGHGYLVTLTGL